jgi:hypothetical protein
LLVTRGVAQLAIEETAVSVSATPRLCLIPELSESSARGVGQLASVASADSGLPRVWFQRFSLNSSVALSLL